MVRYIEQNDVLIVKYDLRLRPITALTDSIIIRSMTFLIFTDVVWLIMSGCLVAGCCRLVDVSYLV